MNRYFKKFILVLFILLFNQSIYSANSKLKIKIGKNYKILKLRENYSATNNFNKNNNLSIIKNHIPSEGRVIYPQKSRSLPVYEDNTGRIYIPTGNLIIELTKKWKKKKVSKWMQQNSLTIIKKVSRYRNMYEVKITNSINSLEKSNFLNNNPDVINCSPNILTEISEK